MDEEPGTSTPPLYKDKDIVWVKLGSLWWPGEVTKPESLPEDLDFKKPPLVIVKFFDEDKYEYVRNWGHIFPYNCEKKTEFIKKGMAAFRNKSGSFGKFPVDVSSAEVKCGGNASILSDPMFLPEKKINYFAELFKTPKQKKVQKDIDERRGRKKTPKGKFDEEIPASKKFQITHRRFLGFDDYKAYICVQFIGKDVHPEDEDPEIKKLNADADELFHCHSCTFVTRSTDLMVLHCKSHIQGVYTTSKKTTKITSSSLDTGSGSASDRTPAKRKRVNTKKKSTTPNTENSKRKKQKSPVLDIRSDLLAEWDDSEEDNEEIVSSLKNNEDNEDSVEVIESEEEDESTEKVTTDDEKTIEPVKKPKKTYEKMKKDVSKKKSTQEEVKSCFDFDDEDDMQEELVAVASSGRKIPRVIPEKRKSLTEINEIASSKDSDIEDMDINREEILKESEDLNHSLSNNGDQDAEFKDLMESTAMPDIPDMTQNTLKPEQNFHDGNTVKFPDKHEAGKSPPHATKLTSPKKRFVKSFEDFELEMRRKVEGEKSQDDNSDLVIEDDKIENVSTEEIVSVDKHQQEEDKSQIVDVFEETDSNIRLEDVSLELENKESEDVPKEAVEDTSSTKEDERLTEEDHLDDGPKNLQSLPVRPGRQRKQHRKKERVQYGQRWSSRNKSRKSLDVRETADVEGELKPVKEDVKPSHEEVQPVKEDVKPSDEEVQPVKEDVNLADQEVQPVTEDLKIPDEEPKQLELEIKPLETEQEVATKENLEEQLGLQIADVVKETLQVSVVLEPKVKKKRGRPRKNSKIVEELPNVPESFEESHKVQDVPFKVEDIPLPPEKIEDLSQITTKKYEEPLIFEGTQPNIPDEPSKSEDVDNILSKNEKIMDDSSVVMESVAEETKEQTDDVIEDKKLIDDVSLEPTKKEPDVLIDVTGISETDIQGEIISLEDKKDETHVPFPVEEQITVQHTSNDIDEIQKPVEDNMPEKTKTQEVILEPTVVEPQLEVVGPVPQVVEPEPQVVEPEPHVVEPELQVVDPEPQVVEPEPHVVEPELQVVDLEPQVVETKSHVVESELVVETEPQVVKTEPQVVESVPQLVEPEHQVVESEVQVVETEPQMLEPEPQIVELRPEVIEPESKVVELQPEMVEPQPEMVEAQPETIQPQPEVVEPQPEIIEPQPESVEPQTEEPKQPKLCMKFAKLKDKLMSKIIEDRPLSDKPEKPHRKGHKHKIAKVRILESYRKKQHLKEEPEISKPEEKVNHLDSADKSGFDFSLNESNTSLRMAVQNIIDNILPEDEEKGIENVGAPKVEEKQVEKEELIFPPKKNLQKIDEYKHTTSKITLLPKKKRRKTIEERAVSPDLFEEGQAITPPPPKKKIFAFPREKNEELTTNSNKADTKLIKTKDIPVHKEDMGVETKIPDVNIQPTVVYKAEAHESFNLSEMLAENKDSYPIEESLLHPEEQIHNNKKSSEDLSTIIEAKPTENVEEMDQYNKADDFSPIGNASFELPEDAICLPSRRTTRRKTSEEQTVAKQTLDESIPIKRKNEDTLDVLKSTCGKRKRKSTSVSESTIVKEKVPEITVPVTPNKEEQIEIEQITFSNEEIIEETVVSSENIIPDEHLNEMEVKLANSTEDGCDDFKFSIQTNLSNFSKAEELSAVALATLSEIQAEKNDIEIQQTPPFNLPTTSELVQVEGNVTVMSEKDLVDGQVEITSDKIISSKKEPVTLTNFSVDFEQQAQTVDNVMVSPEKPAVKNHGTEFSSKLITNKLDKVPHEKKGNAYERLELLDILEGNSNSSTSSSEQKFKESFDAYDKTDIVHGICDFEECIPQQIVVAKPKDEVAEAEVVPPVVKPVKSNYRRSKLLERLTEPKVTETNIRTTETKIVATPPAKLTVSATKTTTHSGAKQPAKFFIKSTKHGATVVNKSNSNSKPIILSEQIIPPPTPKTQVITAPKRIEDIEDVETAFVIPKMSKISTEEPSLNTSTAAKASGKPKILHQTIITAEGEIIQPSEATAATAQTDFNVFDINSMPIVLSDQILTPESIENMPIMLSGDDKVLTPVVTAPTQKKIVTTTVQQKVVTTSVVTTSGRTPGKTSKPRILQSNAKIKANSPLLPNTVKTAKYIIVPSNPTTSLPQGKVIVPANIPAAPATKQVISSTKTIVRKPSPASTVISSTKLPGSPSSADLTGTGNKIMIFTNQQGQQHRLLLTPAQQKMLGYQTTTTQPGKVTTKTIVKSGVLPKGLLEGTAGTSGIFSKSSAVHQRVTVAQSAIAPGLLIPTTQAVRTPKTASKRGGVATPRPITAQKQQKTILIKNQHGQTVRKIQGTDDAELDKQVAEQLEAIKASARLMQNKTPEIIGYKPTTTPKTPVRRSVSKKTEITPKKPPTNPSKFGLDSPVPALTPISSNKKSPSDMQAIVPDPIQQHVMSAGQKTPSIKPPTIEANTDTNKSPPQQLVIQDAQGNQTTVAVGQILALPSETVDGQPQSYMLVTLDESGNLTPLNNEALMSLDPNLGMNFDINNMMLELDQNKATLVNTPQVSEHSTVVTSKPTTDVAPKTVVQQSSAVTTPPLTSLVETAPKPVISQPQQQVVVNTDPVPQQQQQQGGQQLIVTGDPIATQKFLESLSEGTTDLANILANAEGSSILIQADGQQILINTNTDNQMLLNVADNTEAGGNPIFANQSNKNQDILAAALADTDVFQQDQQHSTQKLTPQLSPNSTLYPMNVGNVLETSLTLSSPIMTPLEVPSTNSKKIDDTADILTQIPPKNIDLPITITDPNISQTVAQQHVANLMANELPTMELSLPISEPTISVTSSELSSPSFVYSLPSLDDTVVDIGTSSSNKPFNSSMPLLTEDQDEDSAKNEVKKSSEPSVASSQPGFMEDQEEGLCTLGGQICSSLSEPPPDMFDIPESNNFSEKPAIDEEISSDMSSVQAETSSVNSEGSCEIPIQPNITVSLSDLEPRPRVTEEENGPSGNHMRKLKITGDDD